MTSLIALAAQPILACPLCMGGADDQTAIAANSAIGVMLVLLLIVLGGFLTFIGYLAKRAKADHEMIPVPVPVSKNPKK